VHRRVELGDLRQHAADLLEIGGILALAGADLGDRETRHAIKDRGNEHERVSIPVRPRPEGRARPWVRPLRAHIAPSRGFSPGSQRSIARYIFPSGDGVRLEPPQWLMTPTVSRTAGVFLCART